VQVEGSLPLPNIYSRVAWVSLVLFAQNFAIITGIGIFIFRVSGGLLLLNGSFGYTAPSR
jgi:hypothetical protein